MAALPTTPPIADEQLPIHMSPEAFRRFVRGGQLLKLASFLLGLGLLVTGRVSALDLGLCAVMYGLTMLGITAGFHRLFSHRSYEAHPVLRGLLAVLGTMAGQGTALIWAATHRKHHQFSDQPQDPHSPHAEAGSILGRFWQAHVGWILNFFPRDWERYVPDLLQDPFLVSLHRRSMLWVLAGVLLPGLAGGLISASWQGALSGMLWGGWARLFLVEQSVCLVNSAGHLWGRRPFETRDRSTNSWAIALLVLGDGWHNGHHAFPASVRHGLAWWELDVTYACIRLWKACGLARNLVLPTPEQVAAKRRSP